MATAQPMSKPPTSEQALRARIHRLFFGRAPLLEEPVDAPPFWVAPTEKQMHSTVLDLPDGVESRDEVLVRLEEERRWLETPHVMLSGQSPAELLAGDEDSRQRIERFLTDLEDAVAGGVFR